MEFKASKIQCGPQPNTYLFALEVHNLTGYTVCTASISTTQAGVTLNAPSVPFSGSLATITGTISVSSPPATINVSVTMTCDPPKPPFTCTLPFTFTTPCCDKVVIKDQTVCASNPYVTIPLLGCGSLSNIQQINWYVATPSPNCPPDPPVGGPVPAAWGAPVQSSSSCTDLTLPVGNKCVLAEVIFKPNNGPCTKIYSNIASISLCQKITCKAINADQKFCNSGTPDPLQLQVIVSGPGSPCKWAVSWFDPKGNPLAGIPPLYNTYQPPMLTYGGANATLTTPCYSEYRYRAVLNSLCDKCEEWFVIRVYNPNGSPGTLVMDPKKPMPLCYGDDATLRYTPGCAEPMQWRWEFSYNNTTWAPVIGAGANNPVYNTNKLYKDVWYRVVTQNGVCPEKSVSFFIDVKDQLQVLSFGATAFPPCSPTKVNLKIQIAPCTTTTKCGCNYTIEWYKDGNLIGSSPVSALGAANFSYLGNSSTLPGNYYAVVKDNCCPGAKVKTKVVTINPFPELAIAGPCFLCKNQPVTLTGLLANPPSNCTSYIYKWYRNGGLVATQTSTSTTPQLNNVLLPGTYVLTMTCGGCTYTSKPFVLKLCP